MAGEHCLIPPGPLDAARLDRDWLALFDLRKGRSWEKLFVCAVDVSGKNVQVVGC
jgi:hypothetical protein